MKLTSRILVTIIILVSSSDSFTMHMESNISETEPTLSQRFSNWRSSLYNRLSDTSSSLWNYAKTYQPYVPATTYAGIGAWNLYNTYIAKPNDVFVKYVGGPLGVSLLGLASYTAYKNCSCTRNSRICTRNARTYTRNRRAIQTIQQS